MASPTEHPLELTEGTQKALDSLQANPDLKKALDTQRVTWENICKALKDDQGNGPAATLYPGDGEFDVTFAQDQSLNQQLALNMCKKSYGELNADQRYLITTVEMILKEQGVNASAIQVGDKVSFDFNKGTYSFTHVETPTTSLEGALERKARQEAKEKSTADRERLLADIEKSGNLFEGMRSYGDNPTYTGRVDFLKTHDGFVDRVNSFLPAGSPQRLDASKDNFGYKSTDNATQNIAFLKAYLQFYRGTLQTAEAAPPAPVSPEIVGAPGAPAAEAETMPTMPAGAPTAAPVESTEAVDSRVDALAAQVQSLATELDQASGSELFTPKGHEHLRELRARALEMRKQYNELLPNATDEASIKKLHRIDLKLRTAERFSIVMLFKGPKEKVAAPSLESIKDWENLSPDEQVDVLASVVDMLNTELLFTYGIEMITEKGREHFRNLRTTTIAMRTWYNELRPEATDASTRKLRDIDQDLRKAEGYVDMLYRAPKEKVDPAEPAASTEVPAVAPAAVPEESTDVDSAEHVRLSGEMGAHARRNAWAGVEADFENLAALPGETPSYDEYMLGAQAALNEGNILAARDRFREADALQPEGRAQLELDTISKNYAEVQLSSSKPGTLAPIDRPFDPIQRAAIDFAAKQIHDGESFDGLLPRGDYTFNGNKITVGAAPAEVVVPVSTVPLATDWTNIQPESQVRAAQLMTDAPAPAAEAQPEASTEDSLAAKKAGEALGIKYRYQMDEDVLEIETNTYFRRSMEAPRDFAIQYDVPGEPHFLRVTYNKPEVDRDGRIKTTVEFETATDETITVPVETELPNRATIDAYLKAQRQAGRPLDFARVAAHIAWERYEEALQIALKTVKPTVDAGFVYWKSTLHAPATEPTYTEDEVVAPPAGPRPTSGPIDFDFEDKEASTQTTERVVETARVMQRIALRDPTKEGLTYMASDPNHPLNAAERTAIETADKALRETGSFDGELPTGPYMLIGSDDPFEVYYEKDAVINFTPGM